MDALLDGNLYRERGRRGRGENVERCARWPVVHSCTHIPSSQPWLFTDGTNQRTNVPKGYLSSILASLGSAPVRLAMVIIRVEPSRLDSRSDNPICRCKRSANDPILVEVVFLQFKFTLSLSFSCTQFGSSTTLHHPINATHYGIFWYGGNFKIPQTTCPHHSFKYQLHNGHSSNIRQRQFQILVSLVKNTIEY